MTCRDWKRGGKLGSITEEELGKGEFSIVFRKYILYVYMKWACVPLEINVLIMCILWKK